MTRAILVPGLKHRISYRVDESTTVPQVLPGVSTPAAMPPVLATAYLVGLFEWACTELTAQHLEAGEGSVGTHVDVSHVAATPPGLLVTVECELVEVDGARLGFAVEGHDGVDVIGRGRHERRIVGRAAFDRRAAEKKGRIAA